MTLPRDRAPAAPAAGLVAFGVTGFVVKGLLWLVIIGIALFVITRNFGMTRGRSRT